MPACAPCRSPRSAPAAQAAGMLGLTRYWTPEIHLGAFNLPPYIAEHLPQA